MFLDDVNQQESQVEVMEATQSPLAFWTDATPRQRAIIVTAIVALLALVLFAQSNLRSNGQIVRALTAEQAALLAK